MGELKDGPAAVHLQIAEPTAKDETVVGMETSLKRFLDRQHTLTGKQAVKESWKPLAWCMFSPQILFSTHDRIFEL